MGGGKTINTGKSVGHGFAPSCRQSTDDCEHWRTDKRAGRNLHAWKRL